MKLSKLLAKKSIRNVRGQGMSEYLIIVALIAVAGIAVMGLFGGAARNQVAGLANEIAGGATADSTTAITNANNNANVAREDAAQEISLSNYGGSDAVIEAGNAGAAVTRADGTN